MGDGCWQALRTLPIQQGQRHYHPYLTLTRQKAFGPVHLLLDWTHDNKEPRYIVTNQWPDRHAWRRGRKRFWIEPLFRDWKSYGFDLESSRIDDDDRLDHLLLGMALATLWLIHLGHWVLATDRDRRLTANARRDYSIFRLGRDYARRSVLCHWQLPVIFRRRL